MSPCPLSEFVIASEKFVSDRFNTSRKPIVVRAVKPRPESRRDVERVVAVLRFDEHIGVEQIHHATPSSAARFWKVSCFFVLNKRYASR